MDAFHCPHCGGVLSTDDIAGTTVKCQYCDSVLPIPSWLEEDIETSILYANDKPFLAYHKLGNEHWTTLLDKGVTTPNEAREMALKDSEPIALYANGAKYFLLNSEARESAFKADPQKYWANGRWNYDYGDDFVNRFNTIGLKYGVECLAPNMYLADVHTSIEETAMGVIVRKDGFKLSKAIRKMFRKK